MELYSHAIFEIISQFIVTRCLSTNSTSSSRSLNGWLEPAAGACCHSSQMTASHQYGTTPSKGGGDEAPISNTQRFDRTGVLIRQLQPGTRWHIPSWRHADSSASQGIGRASFSARPRRPGRDPCAIKTGALG